MKNDYEYYRIDSIGDKMAGNKTMFCISSSLNEMKNLSNHKKA